MEPFLNFDLNFQGDGRKSLRFYHWLVYDMRLRILYTTVLGILLGILLPVLIYVLVFTSEERPKYGVCLASTKYRSEVKFFQLMSSFE